MSAKIGKKVGGLRTGAAAGSKVTGDFVDLGVIKIYYFTTAITTGVTAVPATADIGDLAITTNATGGGSLLKNVAGVWTAV